MIEFPESSRVFSRAVDKDVISVHLQRKIHHIPVKFGWEATNFNGNSYHKDMNDLNSEELFKNTHQHY